MSSINAAYIVIGLLYGKGDYGATIDISTRCGYDSDCNPANAAGILGTITGYANIPDYWMQGLDKVEDRNFQYTDMSLHKVYAIGYQHAVEMIRRNGGIEDDDSMVIQYQVPQTLPLEIGFEGIYPTKRRGVNAGLTNSNNEVSIDITGCGFVLAGYASTQNNQANKVLEADLYIDGNFVETIKMPTSSLTRKHDVAWSYDLSEGEHAVTLKSRNIPDGYRINIREILVYSGKNPGKQVYF